MILSKTYIDTPNNYGIYFSISAQVWFIDICFPNSPKTFKTDSYDLKVFLF